ncbi:MAG TPA: SPOR domain-containing protein [Geopsychrobacteraceae bacterium]|nr:SPOR domain-containing protein [Geopsychrobacteraceae bacterium]
MSKRDDLFDVDPPGEESSAEGQDEDFFFEANEEDSKKAEPQHSANVDDESVDYQEVPVKVESGSRQRILLLLLLVVLSLGAAYFYLGDMLFAPEPVAPPKVVQSKPQKLKIPERKPVQSEKQAVEDVVMPTEKVVGTPVKKQPEAAVVAAAAESEPVVAADEPAAEQPAKDAPKREATSDVAEKKPEPEAEVAAVNSEEKFEKIATSPMPKGPYVLQIGAYVLESNLVRTLDLVKSLGYEPIVLDGKKNVSMTRLRVGAYPEKVARQKLIELQKLAPSAFLLLEGDQMALYAGSYYGLDRARSDSDLLYQHDIHLDEETVEVAVPIQTVQFGAFSNAREAEVIAEKARKKGLDTLVIKKN